ncbi:MAG: DUF4097 domain-containing protein [Clostridiaceae bacterium]|nr:DUF4097 domain-containing protein [Clostridiaceae bacterium]
MTTVQRIIKYLAIAFAIVIIINIIGWMIFTLSIFKNVLGLTKGNNNEIVQNEAITTDFDSNEELKSLKVKLNYADLIIKNGDTLKVINNDEEIKCSQKGNQIIIEDEKDWELKFMSDTKQVVIYIPEDIIFDEVNIESGAGKLDIETLKTDELKLDIGAGKTDIQNLVVNKKANINGGVGTVKISSGNINDLKLSMGVGKFEVTSTITGNSKIDAGIGKLDINLEDDDENYTIETSKGIGSIYIFEKSVSDDIICGNGENYIVISGGIGSIKVK